MRGGHTKLGRFIRCANCTKEFWAPPSLEKRGCKTCSMACRDSLKRSTIYDDEGQKKKCSLCEQWKSFADFAVSRGAKAARTGVALQAYCRKCSLEKSEEWARSNPESKKQHRRVSYARNIDSLRAKARNRTPEQRAQINQRALIYRGKSLAKRLLLNRLRRHRLRAAGEIPDRYEIGRMLCSQDARCTYCMRLLMQYHIDHKTPVSRGGTNDAANLQLLCPTCNLKKSAATHEEYMARLTSTNVGVV